VFLRPADRRFQRIYPDNVVQSLPGNQQKADTMFDTSIYLWLISLQLSTSLDPFFFGFNFNVILMLFVL